jgi:hypothetical protein
MRAAELKSLVSVVYMLVKSSSKMKLMQTVKKQLFIGRQNMHHTVYETTAIIVNSLRSICPQTEDAASILNCLPIKHLLNVLLTYSKERSYKFAAKQHKLSIKTSSAMSSLHMTPKGTYTLFSPKYKLYKSNDSQITSLAMVKTPEAKFSLLNNFFDIEYLSKRFNVSS